MPQTQENGKKKNFGHDFGQFDPSLDPESFSTDSISTNNQTLQAIIGYNFKEN